MDPGGKASSVDKILDAMLAGASYDGQQSPFAGTAGKIRVWLRRRRWADSSGIGNDRVVINQVIWEGARIDRALYESTHQSCCRRWPPTGCTGSPRAPRSPTRSRGCSPPVRDRLQRIAASSWTPGSRERPGASESKRELAPLVVHRVQLQA